MGFLDYDRAIINSLEEDHISRFCGVGNPFLAGKPEQGESILDIGCGAGVDLAIALMFIGKEGFAAGIDVTREMLDTASAFLQEQDKGKPPSLVRGEAEHLPFAEQQFERVISNGVLNMSPQKEFCYREICRVLKPGCSFQYADIVLDEDTAGDVENTNTPDAWSD